MNWIVNADLPTPVRVKNLDPIMKGYSMHVCGSVFRFVIPCGGLLNASSHPPATAARDTDTGENGKKLTSTPNDD
jgi:hypothetical protein